MTRFEHRPVGSAPEPEPIGGAGRGEGRKGQTGSTSQQVPELDGRDRHGASGRPSFHTRSEHDSDVVAVLDAEGRLRFVSASAERVFGFDASRAVGLDALELFEPGDADQVRLLFKELVAGRRLSVSLELETVTADGRRIDLDLFAVNHLDDPIRGVVVNVRDVTEQKRLERSIREEDLRQAIVIDSLADAVMMVDVDGTIVRVNEAFEIMFETPRVQLVGTSLADARARAEVAGFELVTADATPLGDDVDPLARALRTGRRITGLVIGVRLRWNEPRTWVQLNSQPIRDMDGQVTGAVISIVDVTGARESDRELRREEQFLQVLLDTLDEGILACDADGRITVFNPSARRLHGLADDVDPIGTIPSTTGMRRLDGSPVERGEHPLDLAMTGERVSDLEVILESENGEQRKVSVNGQALVDEDDCRLGAVVAMHDVTEQKLNEERLAELALRDPLTGLANRTLLAERLQQAIDGLASQVPSGSGESSLGIAVFLLDLDEFKEINDELGHDVGDDMLIAVARRLAAIVRPSDTVARLGGDEFVVVCDIESGEGEMVRIGERISAALARPYRIDGRTLTALASVGGVYVDNPETDPSKLLSRADDAMYGVKWSRRRDRRSMTD